MTQPETIELIFPRLPIGKNDTWKSIGPHRIRVVGLKRMHFRQYANYRNGWMIDLQAMLAYQGIHGLDREKVRKKIEIIQYRPRLLDEDNLAASCGTILDAMKRINVIWDDSPRWIEKLFTQHRVPSTSPYKTVIRIESLGENT